MGQGEFAQYVARSRRDLKISSFLMKKSVLDYNQWALWERKYKGEVPGGYGKEQTRHKADTEWRKSWQVYYPDLKHSVWES